MQSCYNCIVTFSYPKFTFGDVHLQSNVTTLLFGWVHFPFGFVKKTFEGYFSFYTIFSSYTFYPYTFHSYTFHSCTFDSYTFHSYTFHSSEATTGSVL